MSTAWEARSSSVCYRRYREGAFCRLLNSAHSNDPLHSIDFRLQPVCVGDPQHMSMMKVVHQYRVRSPHRMGAAGWDSARCLAVIQLRNMFEHVRESRTITPCLTSRAGSALNSGEHTRYAAGDHPTGTHKAMQPCSVSQTLARAS